MSLKRINYMKPGYLINALFVLAIALCISSLFVLNVTLSMPILFSSFFLSLSELLWAFAIINLCIWVLYKLINQKFLSHKITRLQIVTTFVSTLSFCSIEWWGRFIIHGRRYVEISKTSMGNSPILFKAIIGAITIIFFASLFLFLFNAAIGFYRRLRT
jgi:hypothetical protein